RAQPAGHQLAPRREVGRPVAVPAGREGRPGHEQRPQRRQVGRCAATSFARRGTVITLAVARWRGGG
ncbi:hypothetical protein K7G98_17460, partial [Saccharothrix sp. MB29]|nr:hypothetical protein [Saccharothrix sp. MB29]